MDIFCTAETFVRLLTPCLCYFVMLLFKKDTYRSDNNDREYTELKIYGILMIYSGVLDIAYWAMDIRDVNTLPGGYSTSVAIGVYVYFAVCALMTLATFRMGGRHYAASRAPQKPA